MVLVLRRLDLQPNIREHNHVVKQDPTVFVISVQVKVCAVSMEPYEGLLNMWY